MIDTVIENPKLDIEVLLLIERRLENNQISEQDFELLQAFLNRLGASKDFLLHNLNAHGIQSFASYTSPAPGDRERVELMKGFMKGVILAIKENIRR